MEKWQCSKCKDTKSEELWTFGVGIYAEHIKADEWFCAKCLEKMKKKIDRKLAKK